MSAGRSCISCGSAPAKAPALSKNSPRDVLQPLIGITAARTTSPSGLPQYSVVEAYVRAVSQAGACPLLIPSSLSENELDTILQRLDGVLFSGGGDIDPRYYGLEPH